MKLIVTVFFHLILISSLAFAQVGNQPGTFKPGSEPDGFRGINWGTHISQLKNMSQVYEDGDRKYYERKKDELEIGGAKLHKIIYVFWRDRLMEVRVAILKNYGNPKDQLSNFKLVREMCFDKFGERSKPMLGKEEYSWVGTKTWMYLGYEEPGFMRLIVGSTELNQQRKALEEQKAQLQEFQKKKKSKAAKGF